MHTGGLFVMGSGLYYCLLVFMARPLRIEYPGAFFHVTARGNAKKTIFYDDFDRGQFLSILGKTIEKYNWRCHALVLMDNHYHLLLETLDPTLSKGMRQLNGLYAEKHNQRYGTVGHLFQGRFKAFLIEEATYFLTVARYIVLNPVRANMVRHPADYRWSSYRATAGLEMVPSWLTIDRMFTEFKSASVDAHSAYRKFVAEGIGLSSPFEACKKGIILGSDQFIADLREKVELKDIDMEVILEERMQGRPSLEAIFDGVDGRHERNLAICLARDRLQYAGVEIARFLSLHPSTVSRVVMQ